MDSFVYALCCNQKYFHWLHNNKWTEHSYTATDRPPIIIFVAAIATATATTPHRFFFHCYCFALFFWLLIFDGTALFFLQLFDLDRSGLINSIEAFSLQFFHFEFSLGLHKTIEGALKMRENDKREKAGASTHTHTNLYTKMWLIIFFCAFIFPAYYLTAMVEVSTFYSLKREENE